MLGKSSVEVIYLVDSYGSLYPLQIRQLAERYLAAAEKYGKQIGIHAHNNQQLAFANTTECAMMGVSYLDATMASMDVRRQLRNGTAAGLPEESQVRHQAGAPLLTG